jgi:hypothetical protein
MDSFRKEPDAGISIPKNSAILFACRANRVHILEKISSLATVGGDNFTKTVDKPVDSKRKLPVGQTKAVDKARSFGDKICISCAEIT